MQSLSFRLLTGAVVFPLALQLATGTVMRKLMYPTSHIVAMMSCVVMMMSQPFYGTMPGM